MFCQKCGHKLEDGALFCGNCGAPQATSTQKQSKPIPLNEQLTAGQPVPKTNNSTDTTTDKKDTRAAFMRILSSGFVIYPLLIVVPFLGIPFMWFFNKTFSIKKKIILTVIFGLWLIFLAKTPSSKEQAVTSTPQEQAQQILQTQEPQQKGQPSQEHTGQQNSAPTAIPRKSFGKSLDFWRTFRSELKNNDGFDVDFTYKDESGYISPAGDHSERSIWVSLDTPFFSDEVNGITIRLSQNYIKDQRYLAVFLYSCFKLVDTLSQDLSVDERNKLMEKLHMAGDEVSISGTWRKKHNDVEYIFENNLGERRGVKFTAQPVKR